MTVGEIARVLEEWAPTWSAWERDNVGLQVGDIRKRVRTILVTLDVTEAVAQEAVARKADLIVSHHPLLFRPLSAVSAGDPTGRIVLSLAKKSIAVYSAHTNLDATTDGVSFSLARSLGLLDIGFLAPLGDTMAKLVVFVPESHLEAITRSMAEAGAGVIGNYSFCSFRSPGIGTFRGSDKTNPHTGRAGNLEHVDEIRLEMAVPRGRVHTVIRAMKSVHPYEEVAYDVYELSTENPNFGMGAIGNLPKKMKLKEFLALVSRRLQASSIRHTGELGKAVKRIAVCGGSGSELLATARSKGADIFLTSDTRYHTFHEADDRIALVDAGHWETEHVVLDTVVKRLQRYAATRRQSLTVLRSKKSKNPIRSFSIDGRR